MKSYFQIVLLLCAWLAGCTDQVITLEQIARNDRGVAEMGKYEYTDATRTFAALAAEAPSWIDVRVNFAIATLNRQEEGDDLNALEMLREVLKEEPGHLRAIYTSALIHLNRGELDLATSNFLRVTEADPMDAYAAYFLGQSYLQVERYAEAAETLLRAVKLDPYLRSAYWAGALALRRLGRDEEARLLLADYQRFAPNPAAKLAGLSYKRMGIKAEALAATPDVTPAAPLPAGPIFSAPVVIDSGNWSGSSLTIADVDGDAVPELFIDREGGGAVLTWSGDGGFEKSDSHPLAAAASGSAALWGDVDDDGLTDRVQCSAAGSQIWQQKSDGGWVASYAGMHAGTHVGMAEGADAATESEPESATDQGMTMPCTAGAIFDADHDGDLDFFITGSNGNELYSNNRDGSFRTLADDMGLRGRPGRQVLAADLDADRDMDVMVLNREPPHDLFQNDRTWQYQSLPGLDDLRGTALLAVTVADTDADGRNEIYGLADDGQLLAWANDGAAWNRRVIMAPVPGSTVTHGELSIADFNGDGALDLLKTWDQGFQIVNPATGEVLTAADVPGLASAIAVTLRPASGPGLITAGAEGVKHWPAGPGRHEFLTLAPSGRSQAEQMRSNASGIGTQVKLRTAGNWTLLTALDTHSGPGQSLAPLGFGLGGRDRADFVALEWSDGVSQTEIDLEAGRLHAIAENQRQLASCPVVFAWDGDSYRFVSDVLGVGGMGFFAAPGEYAPPRPFEGYLLEESMLVPRDGRYHIKFTEPMEENAYLDAAEIHVYDLPEGWSMVLDERMEIVGPPVTGRPITYRRSQDPARVTTGDGEDVTGLVLAVDQVAPPVGEIDHRFIGLLHGDQVLTLEFDRPLTSEGAVLVADGWIEYPYSQTVFAAWQAGVLYRAPTLEVRDGDGRWHVLAEEFGYPAGMPRRMALPLPDLPPGTDAIRLSSNMEIYWDRLQIVWEEPVPDAARVTLTPVVARVAKTGFARRTTGAQRLPHYDYSTRATYWDAKFQRGYYTALGDALDLVNQVDGAVAIIGGGEEVHLEFESLPAPRPGTNRFFVLDFRGWAKDMDLYTQHGATVGPLPVLDGLSEAALLRREQLHSHYNVRFQEGL